MAQSLHISTQYLRELVSQGHVTCSHRTEGGHRRYTNEDLENARAFLQPPTAAGPVSEADPPLDESAMRLRRWKRADEVLSLRYQDFQIENAYLARLNELLFDDDAGEDLRHWTVAERTKIDDEVVAVASAIDRLCAEYAEPIDQARTETNERMRRAQRLSLIALFAFPLMAVFAALGMFMLVREAYMWGAVMLVLMLVYWGAWSIAVRVTTRWRKDARYDLDRQYEFDWQVLGRENVQTPGQASHAAGAMVATVPRVSEPLNKLRYADRTRSQHRAADPLRHVPSVWRRDGEELQTWRDMELRSQDIWKRLGQLERLEQRIRDCERYSYRLHETA